MTTQRLHRSSKDRMLFGVASGMAEYFDVDVTLVRLLWLLFIFATGGAGILLYIALAIIMPREETTATEPRDVIRENLESMPGEAAEAGRRLGEAVRGPATEGQQAQPSPTGERRRRNTLALVLITIGLILLTINLGWWSWFRWDIFWPLVLIAIGVAIIVVRYRRS